MRPNKDEYYLNIASVVLRRGTCIRRNYGSVIVNNDTIVGTGYTGSPRGGVNCCDLGKCMREELGVKSGERYELCKSVHSEINAIMTAGRDKCIGATLYLACVDMKTGEIINGIPCDMCYRTIVNAGITKIVTLKSLIIPGFETNRKERSYRESITEVKN